MEYTLCVPCLFGLEGLAAGELKRLGMNGVRAENGRVYFTGGAEAVITANLCLRTGERVLIQVGSFEAGSFDELFEGTKALPWEDYIPADGAFPVKGSSLNSRLFSVPDCQRIIKKAVATRLGGRYKRAWLPETGPLYQIRFSLLKDRVSLCLDTSGEGLHKRGYRPAHNAAPLRETLAAGMVDLARYRGKGDFCDPFCGSGTLPIEAALTALNRAPGLDRAFAAMAWPGFEPGRWEEARQAARAREFHGAYRIFASDIDPKALEIARANAVRAGVTELIRFEQADAGDFARRTERGVLVTNPPYGLRLLEQREAEELYRRFGAAWRRSGNWDLALLSAHPDFERCFGAQADKKRKLYNGMIKCDLFMYRGREALKEAREA